MRNQTVNTIDNSYATISKFDARETVLIAVSVAAIESDRKRLIQSMTAMATLYKSGSDTDRDYVADHWGEVIDTLADCIKSAGGSKAKEAQQYRNARTYLSDCIKVEFISHGLLLEVARGRFDAEKITKDEHKRLDGFKGIQRVRAAKSIKAGKPVDKTGGKQTGTDKAQNPAPGAKSQNNLERASQLAQQLNLDDLKTLQKVVAAAIRLSERETAGQAAKRAKQQSIGA